MVLFRAVLRLRGEKPEGDNATVAERVGAVAGFDAAPFVRAVQHVRGERKLESGEAGTTLAGYIAGIKRLQRYLDNYDVNAAR
jgi:hypothetical protein